jgi:phage gp29-like protein
MAASEATKYSTKFFKTLGDMGTAIAARFTAKQATYLYVPAISDDPTISALPSTIGQVMDDAAQGECQDQAAFISFMMDKDPKLAAHLLTRQDAVSAANWYLVPPFVIDTVPVSYDDNPLLREFHGILNASGMNGLLRKLNEATTYGYSAVGIEYLPGGVGFYWHPIDPTSIKFDLSGGACLVNADAEELPVEKFPPHAIVIHLAATRSDHPARRGLARMLMWFWLFKHMSLDRWAKFVSRFGIPFLVARMSKSDFESDSRRELLVEALQKMSHKGIVAISGQNASVEPQSVGNQSGTIHFDHVSMVDSHYAMLVLGQLGSSEGEKGRLGNNQSQEDVRQDKRETDCHAIEETIQREIIVPSWMAWKGGDGTDSPQFRLRSLRTKQLKEVAETCKFLFDSGHMADRTFLQMETGIPFTDPPVVNATVPEAPQEGANEAASDSGTKAQEGTVEAPSAAQAPSPASKAPPKAKAPAKAKATKPKEA